MEKRNSPLSHLSLSIGHSQNQEPLVPSASSPLHQRQRRGLSPAPPTCGADHFLSLISLLPYGALSQLAPKSAPLLSSLTEQPAPTAISPLQFVLAAAFSSSGLGCSRQASASRCSCSPVLRAGKRCRVRRCAHPWLVVGVAAALSKAVAGVMLLPVDAWSGNSLPGYKTPHQSALKLSSSSILFHSRKARLHLIML